MVTQTKGTAEQNGVKRGDIMVAINDVQVQDALKGVPKDKMCGTVKQVVVGFPRPVNITFVTLPDEPPTPQSASVATPDTVDATTSKDENSGSATPQKRGSFLARLSLGGKKKSSSNDLHAKESAAPSPPDEYDAVFEAGPLGLSIANRPSDRSLIVSKVGGQAEANNVKLGDAILRINESECPRCGFLACTPGTALCGIPLPHVPHIHNALVWNLLVEAVL